MELCAIVTGCYLGWLILAVFPRKVARLSRRILQDLLILVIASFLFPILCHEVVASLLVAFLALVMYNDLPSPWIGVNNRAVVITGCDKGIGQALALHLDKLGFHVFAGCLFMGEEGERTLVKSASNKLETFALDVTNPQQVERGAEFVSQRLNGKVLHGVVNNAGIMLIGNLEVMTMADIRKVLEVNTIGPIHIFRAFMPLLRQSRRGTARLVNIASNIGLAPASQYGIYAASKSALAILNETWRYELKPMGINVSTIIPSGFKTGIQLYDMEATGNRWWEKASQDVKEYYGKACFIPTPKMKNYRDFLQSDFSSIIDCMTDALLASHPKPIYYKGLLARSLPFLYLHLPSCVWDVIMPHLADYFHHPIQALNSNQGQHH